MYVLILGATGYLGSKIAHALIEQENHLICTRRENSDLSNLENLVHNENLRLIPATIEAIDSALHNIKIEWLINIVCNYGKNGVLYDEVIEANMIFPLKVMNKAVEKGTKRILTIGTGLPDDFNIYSFSKKMFSNFGEFYVKKLKIDFFDLKTEMFYGSDEPESRFIPSLIYNMLLGNEVNVTSGKQYRDIISVNDVVNAILITINSKGKGYTEIPVGTGIAVSISELVDYIWEETGKKSKINKGAIPPREDEPDCIADTSILKELGEWNPVFWKTGIKHMIKDIDKNIHGTTNLC